MGTDAYWVWSCLNSVSYKKRGYYFDLNDKDDLLLFAEDTCKKPVEFVLEVIQCCVSRGLYDNDLYRDYKILTSDRMQDNYLLATAERRRKGTTVTFIDEYLLIEISESNRNVEVVHLEEDKKPKRGFKPAKPKPSKEDMEKEMQERKVVFGKTLEPYANKYSRQMLADFFRYWGEPTKDMKKMRYELEKTWELGGRLATWYRNVTKFESRPSSSSHTEEIDEETKRLEERTKQLAKE